MNVLLVDDQRNSREACRALLPGLGNNPRVVDVATIALALQRRQNFIPDLVLLNYRLRGDHRCRGIAALRLAHPTGTIVVFSGANDPQAMRQCIKAGAAGYVRESAAEHVLIRSLQLALEGVICLPRDAMAALEAEASSPRLSNSASKAVGGKAVRGKAVSGDASRSSTTESSATGSSGTDSSSTLSTASSDTAVVAESGAAASTAELASRSASSDSAPDLGSASDLASASEVPASETVDDAEAAASRLVSNRLAGPCARRNDVVLAPDTFSARQRDSLRLAIKGMPNKIIAEQLGISVGTVKSHLHAGYKLLGVSNRTEASIRVAQLKLML